MIARNFDILSKEIQKLKDVLVVADNDLDGIFSAKQMKIILDKLGIKNEIVIRNRNNSFKELFEELQKINKDEIILLDTPMPDEYLFELVRNKKVIYIDHHKKELPKDVPENLVYFDYRAISGEDIATSVLVYKLGKRLIPDFSKYSIFAMIGAIGDFSYDHELHIDFVTNYKYLYNNTYFVLSFFDLIKILEGLNHKEFLEISLDNLLYIVDRNKKKIAREISKYYKKLLKFEIKLDNEKLLVLECKKPSITTTLFSNIYPNKVIVGYSIKRFLIFKKNTVSVSLRTSRDDVDLGSIAEEFARKYGIEGGGHRKAAGMLINRMDLEKLIKFVEERI